ncbi:rna polymerase ii subunit a c-terminal domain phosphatase ssu72-like [Nannochloropsis oceanica]
MSTISKRPRHEGESHDDDEDEDEEDELSSDDEEVEQDQGDAGKNGAPVSSATSSMPRPDSSNSLSGGGAALPAPSCSKLSYALVCSSNMNRSMEAHAAFLNAGFTKVVSLGTGRMVRLPAATAEGQVSFSFGTPYTEILKELEGQAQADAKLQEFYRRTKLLDILRRNARIKTAPERLQNIENLTYDVIVCFDIRVYDAVQEDLQCREARDLEPICVICIDTKDDPQQAVIAGRVAVNLAQKLEESDDLATDAPEIVETFMEEEGRRLLFQICYL